MAQYIVFGEVLDLVNYNEDEKKIKLIIFDKSYRCEDKEIVVNKIFNYEIRNTNTSTILEIVEMIEKYLIENYS